MKTFRGILAAISITWAIVFSCRLVMIPTPLTLAEEIVTILTMIEFSFYKAKQLEIYEEKSSN